MAEFVMPKLKDDLFGEDEDMGDDNDASNRLSGSSKKQKRRREGVGAFEATDKSEHRHDDMTQKVLKVGMRRRRDTDDYYDEEYHNEKSNIVGNQVEDDDEEEDLGRTAIASDEPNTKKIPSSSSDQILLIDEEHRHDAAKKLGKKERKRLKSLQQEQSKESMPANDDGKGNQERQTKDEDGISMADKGGSGATETATTQSASDNNTGKRKRRKIRSRQKNIYKDNRPMDKRPKHLIPGNRVYQGRPLTDETRSKLDLPPSKAFKSQNWEEYHHTVTSTNGDDSNSHPHYTDSSNTNVGTPVVALGVDELLSEENPTLSSSPTSKTKKPKTKGNKKRKKYKNLSI